MTYPNGPYQNPNPAATAGYDVEQLKKQALTWTILGFLCGGTIGGILGLIGYLKADTDPASAAPLVKWSKIITIIAMVLVALSVVLYIGFIILMMVIGGSAAAYSS